MLIAGKEKLERMRDGREVYIGEERVKDERTLRHRVDRSTGRRQGG